MGTNVAPIVFKSVKMKDKRSATVTSSSGRGSRSLSVSSSSREAVWRAFVGRTTDSKDWNVPKHIVGTIGAFPVIARASSRTNRSSRKLALHTGFRIRTESERNAAMERSSFQGYRPGRMLLSRRVHGGYEDDRRARRIECSCILLFRRCVCRRPATSTMSFRLTRREPQPYCPDWVAPSNTRLTLFR